MWVEGFVHVPLYPLWPEKHMLAMHLFCNQKIARSIRASGPMAHSKVTRFEVIDHRKDGIGGRAFVAYDINVDINYQDDGRTLKIFVTNRESKDD